MQNQRRKFIFPFWVIIVSLSNSSVCQDRQGYTDLELAVISGVSPNKKFAEVYYNITDFDNLAETEALQSAPGCPEPFQGHPWVYYGNPPKCHLSGYRWPCPANMKVLAQRGSVYGYCDCDCKIYQGDQVNSPQAYCYSETKDGNARTLAYIKDMDSCQPLFDQAECPNGQWLILGDDPKQGPYCEQRLCPESVDKYRYYFFDYRNRICHRIRDKCQASSTANEIGKRKRVNYRYQIGLYDWTPRCLPDELANKPGGSRNQVGSILRTSCLDGERYSSILERCIPIRGRLNYGIG